MHGFLKTHADPDADLQAAFDVAVIIPTLLRPRLRAALQSVFLQDLQGRIQILVGIDQPSADVAALDRLCDGRPPNCVVQLFYPGYSTSVRHGGMIASQAGGSLRCVLSYLANARHLAYLDDDNWWRHDHLRLLHQALGRADWAYSLRWFVHPDTLRPVCVDQWESVGPGRGIFAERFSGFVDTNCFMLNRAVCDSVLPLWNRPLPDDPSGMSADRSVYDALCRGFRGAGVGHPTVFYTLNPLDGRHATRMALFGQAYDSAGRESP